MAVTRGSCSLLLRRIAGGDRTREAKGPVKRVSDSCLHHAMNRFGVKSFLAQAWPYYLAVCWAGLGCTPWLHYCHAVASRITLCSESQDEDLSSLIYLTCSAVQPSQPRCFRKDTILFLRPSRRMRRDIVRRERS